MLTDQRDLLDVLKFELYFLEQGGYERSSVAAWHPRFIFEDSPTCVNYQATADRVPCRACALMQLVPSSRRFATHPCWHIALNESGETLDSLYRYTIRVILKKLSATGCEQPSTSWNVSASPNFTTRKTSLFSLANP